MAIYAGKRKGTLRVVVWVKGKRREWVVEGTRKDAKSFEAQKVVELGKQSIHASRRELTFSELCLNHYRPHAELNLRASTWQKVRKYQVATLLEFFGKKKLTEIEPSDVESLKAQLRSQGLRVSSVNNILRVLNTILNFAKEQRFPVAEIKIKRMKVDHEGRVLAWTSDELQRLFVAAENRYPELLRMFIFLANTGCRKGEAIAAEWDWVDLGSDMIRIPANDVWRPKNGRAREIPISDSLKTMLEQSPRTATWLFPNRLGGRYADFPKDLFWEIRDAAGVTGGPHQFRHTFASLFLQSRPDLFLLGQVLGHSHGRVTELYTHLLPDHLQRARNAVNISLRNPTDRG